MSHLVKASTMNHSAKPLPSNVSLKMITLKLNNWVSLQKGAALLQVSLNTRNSYEVSQEDLDCQVLYMKYVKQFFLNMQTIANVSKYRSCKKAAGACLTMLYYQCADNTNSSLSIQERKKYQHHQGKVGNIDMNAQQYFRWRIRDQLKMSLLISTGSKYSHHLKSSRCL